jgi:DUF917 family protein
LSRKLGEQDLEDLSRGAALLGSGGGGDPYIGRLMVREVLRSGVEVTLWDLEEVPEDAFVVPTAMMGAPTVMIEKLPAGFEGNLALQALEEHLGRKATATMPIECGGINSTMPLVVGARAGIPVIDADGMGRAFPELQMETFHVYGVPGTPMAIANEHGDVAILRTHDNKQMEWFARGITIRMGGSALIAEYSMDGATVRRASIPGTLSLGIGLGRAIREARERHEDVIAHLEDALGPTVYGAPHVIFEGKVEDVFRRTTEGFARGSARIRGFSRDRVLDIEFQNEHLIATVEGEVLAVVPDLICVLDLETGEPITTEGMRYGQRVRLITITPPEIMRTPEALAVFGPRAFGIDHDYRPREEAASTVRPAAR